MELAMTLSLRTYPIRYWPCSRKDSRHFLIPSVNQLEEEMEFLPLDRQTSDLIYHQKLWYDASFFRVRSSLPLFSAVLSRSTRNGVEM